MQLVGTSAGGSSFLTDSSTVASKTPSEPEHLPETPLSHVKTHHFKDWPNAAGFNADGETRTPVELQVTGKFPACAAGSLYRTGPGFYKVDKNDADGSHFSCSHWFDGFTTLHKFDITTQDDGSSRVFYTSRRQVDERVEHARKTRKLEGITFGQKRDPCDSFYQKIKTTFAPIAVKGPLQTDVGVVIRVATAAERSRADSKDILTTTTDNSSTKQFSASTLEPLGVSSFKHIHPDLKGPLAAAHAETDPQTGDIFNYNLDLGGGKAVYRVFRSDPKTGDTEILAEISGSDIDGAYIHSLFLTENFVILCIWPAFFAAKGISILWQRNLLDAISKFDPSSKTTWLVIDRRHGRGLVKKFQSPAFFSFHTVNAWEEKSDRDGEVDVMCELVQFPNMDILHSFYYDNLVSDSPGVGAFSKRRRASLSSHLVCYRLGHVPLSSMVAKRQITEADLIWDISSPRAGDLPRINPNYHTKRHRYVWSVLNRGLSSFIDGIGKTDTERQECQIWEQERHTPGEPVFLPNPDGSAEDDGVVLSVVLNGDTGTSYLLCLDGRDMKEIARAEVGSAVGLGFHGMHVPQVTL